MSKIDLRSKSKSDLNVNAQMRTEIDLNESENNLNGCKMHFLKVNLDQSEIDPSWIILSSNGPDESCDKDYSIPVESSVRSFEKA